MAMNPYIAEMYNTNGYAEKVAQVEGIVDAFIKQASAEGLDLSGLSDDQIVDYALDWADEQGGDADGGQDKLAEADYMGRVMAHAYVDEMQKIAAKPLPEGDVSGISKDNKGFQAAKDEYVAGRGDRARARIEERAKRKQFQLDKITNKAPDRKLLEAASVKDRILRPTKEFLSTHRNKLLAGAGVATALGGGYLLGKKTTEKNSHLNGLHEAAVARANELLDMADRGQQVTFSKIASTDESDLDRVITELAWSMLQDEGYVR